MPHSTNWWWIRHAPTGYPGQLIGATDVPAELPDQKSLAKIARKLPNDALWFVSPRLRCQQTALALLTSSGADDIEPATVPAFAEQDFGDWEQLSYDEPVIRDARDFWEDPGNTAPPGGESFSEMSERVRAGVTSLDQDNTSRDPKDIVIVAHAGVIRAAVAMALDLGASQALRLQIDPLSLTRIKSFKSDSNAATHPDNLVTNYWSLQGLNLTATQSGSQMS